MTEFHPDLSDPGRCISVHWSLPMQCFLQRSHRDNWHETLTPDSGVRLRYRYTVRLTQELRDGEWRDLVSESPGLTDSKLDYIRYQFGQRPIVAEVLAEVDRLTALIAEALRRIDDGPQMANERVEEHWSVVAHSAAETLRAAVPGSAGGDR